MVSYLHSQRVHPCCKQNLKKNHLFSNIALMPWLRFVAFTTQIQNDHNQINPKKMGYRKGAAWGLLLQWILVAVVRSSYCCRGASGGTASMCGYSTQLVGLSAWASLRSVVLRAQHAAFQLDMTWPQAANPQPTRCPHVFVQVAAEPPQQASLPLRGHTPHHQHPHHGAHASAAASAGTLGQQQSLHLHGLPGRPDPAVEALVAYLRAQGAEVRAGARTRIDAHRSAQTRTTASASNHSSKLSAPVPPPCAVAG